MFSGAAEVLAVGASVLAAGHRFEVRLLMHSHIRPPLTTMRTVATLPHHFTALCRNADLKGNRVMVTDAFRGSFICKENILVFRNLTGISVFREADILILYITFPLKMMGLNILVSDVHRFERKK